MIERLHGSAPARGRPPLHILSACAGTSTSRPPMTTPGTGRIHRQHQCQSAGTGGAGGAAATWPQPCAVPSG